MVDVIPYDPAAYELIHAGAVALAEVESNGMRVDVPYLNNALRRTQKRVDRLAETIESDPVVKEWRAMFRSRTNLDSTDQLSQVLFDRMGHTPAKFTAKSTDEDQRAATDEEALGALDIPFVDTYLKLRRLKKACNTYLKGILRETVDGKIHCFFNLHTVVSFRSSCEAFNFQNLPVRVPEIMLLVRQAFVPRPGRCIVEIDFKGAEVSVAACYHRDPNAIAYIMDKSKDIHRDMAMEIFRLPDTEWTKAIRHVGKNKFVFPQYYGDWWMSCARNMWKAARTLETKSGVPLLDWLAQHGIGELGDQDPDMDARPGTFEAHVKAIEKDFWNNRFPVYTQWKREWYEQYRERGWFKMFTGFVCRGLMNRKQVINYGVQGSAFHVLLWSLTRLVTRELRRYNMSALVVGQIHDSLIADVPVGEVDDYVALCRKIMTRKAERHFPWLTVPIDIEVEVAPPGEPWSNKAPYKHAA